jgi:hypothetical protein
LLLDLADGHLEGVVAFHDGTLLVCDVRSCDRGKCRRENLRRGCDSYLGRIRMDPNDTPVT